MFYVLDQTWCKSGLSLTRAGKFKKNDIPSNKSDFPSGDVYLTPIYYLANLSRDSLILQLHLVLIIKYSYKDIKSFLRETVLYLHLFSTHFLVVILFPLMNLVEVDVLFIAGPPPPPPNDVENDVNWAEPAISKTVTKDLKKLRKHFWIFVEKPCFFPSLFSLTRLLCRGPNKNSG